MTPNHMDTRQDCEFVSDSRPREACGIFGISGHSEAARMTYFGLYALQHRGQESAGIAIARDQAIYAHKGMGLVPDVFDADQMEDLYGQHAIGHVRYSTTGSSILMNAQPFVVQHRKKSYAVAHNGNIVNAYELKRELEEAGSIFQTTMDSEIFLHLFVKNLELGFEQALVAAVNKLKGAFSFVMLTGKGEVVGIKDPYGFRPLCLGRLNGNLCWHPRPVPSTWSRPNLFGNWIRERLSSSDDGSYQEHPRAGTRQTGFLHFRIHLLCKTGQFFLWNECLPDQKGTRETSGAVNRRVDADFVMPFPDSGTYAALGYSEASGIPFEMGMIRNHYVGRTFIQPTQSMRDFGVRVKLNPIKSLLKGKGYYYHRRFHYQGYHGKNACKGTAGTRCQSCSYARERPPSQISLPLRHRFFNPWRTDCRK